MRYCTILRSCDSCPTTMRAASRQAMQSQIASTLTTVRLRNFWTPLRLGIRICRLFHCRCLSKPVLPMASSSCTSCLCGGHRKVEKQRSLRLKMGWSRKCYDDKCMLPITLECCRKELPLRTWCKSRWICHDLMRQHSRAQ